MEINPIIIYILYCIFVDNEIKTYDNIVEFLPLMGGVSFCPSQQNHAS